MQTLGILCDGLPESSRIARKIAGYKSDMQTIILARILDDLNLILWSRSPKATQANKPESLADYLCDTPNKDKSGKNFLTFKTGEEFDRARKAILEKKKNG